VTTFAAHDAGVIGAALFLHCVCLPLSVRRPASVIRTRAVYAVWTAGNGLLAKFHVVKNCLVTFSIALRSRCAGSLSRRSTAASIFASTDTYPRG
jgi:hypothetical protein